MDCTEAVRRIQTDTSLHSVLWNVTAGTSSVRGSPSTGKRPVRTKHHNTRVTKGRSSVIESREWFYIRPRLPGRQKGTKTFQVNNGCGSFAAYWSSITPSRQLKRNSLEGGNGEFEERNCRGCNKPIVNGV